ncbi:MAG: phosphoglycerate mutase (2,3-diphosphoglycerate-independent) [Candidatus Moranbacteria bacterium RIFOXYA12_FULL_44_15]|nr:MAG: phosphoglycerate mutase (2,3-diphosphoglycerate-independent) [Candidatus Moranbacteria bacterium RIFOXYA12_FULL_44_15]
MIKPIVLVVLDGWGIGEKSQGNALEKASLPNIKKLNAYYPHIALQASGVSVGLPWGEPGNSEVGHTALGTGAVIYQNMPRITMSIQNGEFFKNDVFLKAIQNAKAKKTSLHLMGLVGKGGVHSNIDHLYALLELAKKQKTERVFIHAFTDGRDSPPTSGIESISELQQRLTVAGIGKIATIGGRYFGMDRNNNWDRVKKSYDTMTLGEGQKTDDPIKYLRSSYDQGVYDEYIEPAVIMEKDSPVGLIQDGDSVIFFNFREDRARQITKSFVIPDFDKFSRKKIEDIFFATMIQYEENLPVEVAFRPIKIENCLGKILSKQKLSQLRIAETEKFAHVTYFFNGGNEEPFPKEDRIIVPSIDVSSFDKAPEMRAEELTGKVVDFIEKEKYDFILMNYANADIVGHTGNETAAIRAVEVIDECLGKLIPAVISKKGCLFITADHGNVEEMKNTSTGEVDTEHSINPVPLWFITAQNHRKTKNTAEEKVRVAGLLSDIAPTILEILNIKKPEEMTGESLLPILK